MRVCTLNMSLFRHLHTNRGAESKPFYPATEQASKHPHQSHEVIRPDIASDTPEAKAVTPLTSVLQHLPVMWMQTKI